MKITYGRIKEKVPCTPGSGIIIIAGALICTAYLMSAVSGNPAEPAKLDAVSAAAVAALSENDTVSVFLGLDKTDSIVPVWNEIDDCSDTITNTEVKEACTMWSFLADTVRKLVK